MRCAPRRGFVARIGRRLRHGWGETEVTGTLGVRDVDVIIQRWFKGVTNSFSVNCIVYDTTYSILVLFLQLVCNEPFEAPFAPAAAAASSVTLLASGVRPEVHVRLEGRQPSCRKEFRRWPLAMEGRVRPDGWRASASAAPSAIKPRRWPFVLALARSTEVCRHGY